MARGISSILVGAMTGVAISMSAGVLLAGFVIAGIAPPDPVQPTFKPWKAKAAAPRDREWRPPQYGPIAVALAN